MSYILQDIFLICSIIYTNYTQLLYLLILDPTLTKVPAISLPSGIVLVVLNDLFT